MKIFDIFKTKKKIFYHEDDFLQVEIVPAENYFILKNEEDKVDTFSKDHFDGTGFTDIYIRDDESQVKLNQRCINKKDLELILSSMGYSRISIVMTGYGQSYRILHKNCIAFGQGYEAIYYDFENEIVQNIWLTKHRMMNLEKLALCLYELGLKWNLLLQDWNDLETIDLKNKALIDNYLLK